MQSMYCDSWDQDSMMPVSSLSGSCVPAADTEAETTSDFFLSFLRTPTITISARSVKVQLSPGLAAVWSRPRRRATSEVGSQVAAAASRSRALRPDFLRPQKKVEPWWRPTLKISWNMSNLELGKCPTGGWMYS